SICIPGAHRSTERVLSHQTPQLEVCVAKRTGIDTCHAVEHGTQTGHQPRPAFHRSPRRCTYAELSEWTLHVGDGVLRISYLPVPSLHHVDGVDSDTGNGGVVAYSHRRAEPDIPRCPLSIRRGGRIYRWTYLGDILCYH